MRVALVHDWLTDMRGGELRGYDLVLSSSHCVAKGARLAPGALRGSSAHQRSRLRLPSRRPTHEVDAR
jgi:hypothetical protein